FCLDVTNSRSTWASKAARTKVTRSDCFGMVILLVGCGILRLGRGWRSRLLGKADFPEGGCAPRQAAVPWPHDRQPRADRPRHPQCRDAARDCRAFPAGV